MTYQQVLPDETPNPGWWTEHSARIQLAQADDQRERIGRLKAKANRLEASVLAALYRRPTRTRQCDCGYPKGCRFCRSGTEYSRSAAIGRVLDVR